ncbi:hypothetical protein RJ639_033304 [Escallonia herrerae]|uniref:GBF-interacting protein 1 N-terminal domain-containing protein n=1 Tax=Escallonia herrerae TaxID=1293975 RepID=A0AA89B8M8_9ASTE|nr:hypothetical protein RJ639_033304 [Escallonia herrerae]
MSSGGRVSIPGSVRKVIQTIKEITDKHSEEEIYAMLQECSMDPNETIQKLLLQDTFHEVKRKRDRRKENLNKEPAESRWKPGMQGRGNRGGRGNYPPRYTSQDASGGRNSASGKENGISQVSEEGASLLTLPTSQDNQKRETTSAASYSTSATDGPAGVPSESISVVHAGHSFARERGNQFEANAVANISKFEAPPPLAPPADANKKSTIAFGMGDIDDQLLQNSSNISASSTSVPLPGVCFSASDPVLVSSHDSRLPNAVGAIRREVGSQRPPVEEIPVTPAESKLIAADITPSSEVGNAAIQGKTSSKAQGVGKNQLLESSQPAPSTLGGSSVGRPPSNYNSRSPKVIAPQKAVGPNKEWKPKPTSSNAGQGSGTVASEVPAVSLEASTRPEPALGVADSKETTSELESKLEEFHISDNQHVIIPNHLHVPEAERIGFCFGSFDASFGFNTSHTSGLESEKSPPPHSEISDGIEESVEEQSSRTLASNKQSSKANMKTPSRTERVDRAMDYTVDDTHFEINNPNEFATGDEGDYPGCVPSSSHIPEDISTEADVSSSVVPEYESKQATALPPGGHQYSAVHTTPNYGFGLMPPMVGSQLAPFEGTDSQARDAYRLPSFLVQQPFDPASYYAQFYRSGADPDGRISPFHSAGVATKYNGNVAMLSSQVSQSSQEGGNSLLSSTGGPTPLVSQATGVMQNSVAVTQQPLAVFRQPSGMHLPHYPPNYLPYGHYFSPFYVPPPAVHQFLSNGAFPQQPQAGSVYQSPPVTTAKYSLSQYKPVSNTGNSTHIGVPGSYGLYGSSPAGYNPGSAATAGNSTSNEELAGAQFQESNVYIAGQQSEGSGVWVATPGRDISSLQASSFYNLPQGQVAFAPTQAGHGTFTGIYHPAQPVTAAAVHPLLQQSQSVAGAVDMVGPTGSVYQQPQAAQINWPSNY